MAFQWFEDPNLTEEKCFEELFRLDEKTTNLTIRSKFMLVPERLRSPRICFTMFSFLAMDLDTMKLIPEASMTPELCSRMVCEYPDIIKLIPDASRTSTVYEAWVRAHPRNFTEVPDQYKTAKMCEEVFKKHRYAFAYIPDRFKTKEMCASIRDIKPLLKYVPREHLKEVYDEDYNGGDFWHLSVDCMTQDVLGYGYNAFEALKCPETVRHILRLPKEVREVLAERKLIPLDFNPEAPKYLKDVYQRTPVYQPNRCAELFAPWE